MCCTSARPCSCAPLFFIFYRGVVCVVRAADEKEGEECRSMFSADSSEVERGAEKRLAKKGMKFHIKRAPIRLPANPARPTPVDAAENIRSRYRHGTAASRIVFQSI